MLVQGGHRPAGVKGQSPLRGAGAAPLPPERNKKTPDTEAVSEEVTSTKDIGSIEPDGISFK